MKQTAVEWLYSQQIEYPLGDWEYFLKQAKAIEQEQIETAFEEGMFHHTNGLCPDEYYNETFKSE
jgi:hypothetical protein